MLHQTQLQALVDPSDGLCLSWTWTKTLVTIWCSLNGIRGEQSVWHVNGPEGCWRAQCWARWHSSMSSASLEELYNPSKLADLLKKNYAFWQTVVLFLSDADSSFEGKTDLQFPFILTSSFPLKPVHFLVPAAYVKVLLQDLGAWELQLLPWNNLACFDIFSCWCQFSVWIGFLALLYLLLCHISTGKAECFFYLLLEDWNSHLFYPLNEALCSTMALGRKSQWCFPSSLVCICHDIGLHFNKRNLYIPMFLPSAPLKKYLSISFHSDRRFLLHFTWPPYPQSFCRAG